MERKTKNELINLDLLFPIPDSLCVDTKGTTADLVVHLCQPT